MALVWTGFAVVLAAALSYAPLFVRFAGTRDTAWLNFLLFAVGGCFLAAGLWRVFQRSGARGAKIGASILGVLSVGLFAVFFYGVTVFARSIPAASGAPQAGQHAPNFTLPCADGKPVTLAELRNQNRAVLLIFYRGYW